MAGVGHNKPPLKSFTARIEALEEERDNLGADIKEVYVEVKAAGYSPKVRLMRHLFQVFRACWRKMVAKKPSILLPM